MLKHSRYHQNSIPGTLRGESTISFCYCKKVPFKKMLGFQYEFDLTNSCLLGELHLSLRAVSKVA